MRNLPPGERYRRAVLTLDQVRRFRDRIQRDLDAGRFAADDAAMQGYTELLATARMWFPGDPILDRIPEMPDETIRTAMTFHTVLPDSFVTQRTLSYTDRLLNRLETLFGTETPLGSAAAREAQRTARDVLERERTTDAQEVLDAIEGLRTAQPESAPLDARDFGFVLSDKHRAVLTLDYIEAQRAFYSGAHKASALLSGGIIEAMLMDALQRPAVVARAEYTTAVQTLPRQAGGAINWDRASLTPMIAAASALSLLTATAARMAEGARDYRDTVHPNAEVRLDFRAGREDAELMLALVRLVYRDLA